MKLFRDTMDLASTILKTTSSNGWYILKSPMYRTGASELQLTGVSAILMPECTGDIVLSAFDKSCMRLYPDFRRERKRRHPDHIQSVCKISTIVRCIY